MVNGTLPGATVWLQRTGRSAIVDSTGHFDFDSVPAGRQVARYPSLAALLFGVPSTTVRRSDTRFGITFPSGRIGGQGCAAWIHIDGFEADRTS